MASGSASYSVSATNYGRNPRDGYYLLSAPNVVNGDLDVTGNLHVQGTSALDGDVTAGADVNVVGTLDVAGKATFTAGAGVLIDQGLVAGAVTTPGAVNGASVTASGAVNGASVTASGAVSGASVTASGAVNGASVTASGAVTGASVTASGAVVSQNSYTTQANVVAAQNVNTAIGPVITKPCMVTITILERVASGGNNNRTEFGFLYLNGNPALTGGLTYYRYSSNTGGNITLVWGQAPDVNRWTFGSSAGGGCDVIATMTLTNMSP